jgi:putative transposase
MGKWFVSFSCVVEPSLLPPNDLEVGVDMGLTTFATFSDGVKIANPRFFKREKKALAKVQRARKKHATALVHERVVNKRRNFAHQTSKRVIDRYGVICAEKLAVDKMLTGASRKNRVLQKKGSKSVNIADAAWSQFLSYLAYKAESAGRRFVQVNSAYTTQTCSCCGARKLMLQEMRTYSCDACGLVLNRDLNAAKNILRVGLHSLGGVVPSLEAVVFSSAEWSHVAH